MWRATACNIDTGMPIAAVGHNHDGSKVGSRMWLNEDEMDGAEVEVNRQTGDGILFRNKGRNGLDERRMLLESKLQQVWDAAIVHADI